MFNNVKCFVIVVWVVFLVLNDLCIILYDIFYVLKDLVDNLRKVFIYFINNFF